MSVPIQVRRGATAQRLSKVLDSGEPGWDEQQKELYVGDGATAGGIPVGLSNVVVAASIVGGVATLNCAGGRVRNFTLLLTGNATIAVSNLAGVGRVTEFEVEIKQDGAGSRSLALPASFKPLGGSDTAISSAANSVTVLSAKTFDNGVSWRYAMQESA